MQDVKLSVPILQVLWVLSVLPLLQEKDIKGEETTMLSIGTVERF